jgi:uncharacterized coiled-coil DUF342 family protein
LDKVLETLTFQGIIEIDQLNEGQKQFNEGQKQFNEEQKQFNEEQRQFSEEQKQFNEKIEGILSSMLQQLNKISEKLKWLHEYYSGLFVSNSK